MDVMKSWKSNAKLTRYEAKRNILEKNMDLQVLLLPVQQCAELPVDTARKLWL